MESHPVPQDVASFEFKLVGDMTIKQFAYLAAGLVVAYILFVLFSKPFPYVAYPLILISALIGAAFAFVPISERPLDHWVSAFFKAIFSPTMRKWTAKDIETDSDLFKNRLQVYLQAVEDEVSFGQTHTPKFTMSSQHAPTTQSMVMDNTPAVPTYQAPPSYSTPAQTAAAASQSEVVTINQQIPTPEIAAQNMPGPNPAPPTAPIVQPSQNAFTTGTTPQPTPGNQQELKQLVNAAKEAQAIQNQIVQAEHELNLIKTEIAVPGVDSAALTKRFQQVLDQLQTLTQQANAVSTEISKIPRVKPVLPPPPPQPIQPAMPQQPLVMPQQLAAKTMDNTQITLTTTPNIINGIVTDAQNNYVEGVIVVTHDKEGLPVRALKTNKLGQFIAATPLPNGVYTITLEKDNLNFDVLKVELDGTTLPPIRVAARQVSEDGAKTNPLGPNQTYLT